MFWKNAKSLAAFLGVFALMIGCDHPINVSGVVLDGSGSPVENASVSLRSLRDSELCLPIDTDPSGGFELSVIGGSRRFKLHVNKNGYRDFSSEFESPLPKTEVVLILEPNFGR